MHSGGAGFGPVDALDMATVIADAYRDAALGGANMREVADSLERIRDAMEGEELPYRAWDVIDDCVGVAYGEPVFPVIAGLRDRYQEAVIGRKCAGVRASVSENQQAGSREFVTAVAEALAHWRLALAAALAELEVLLAPQAEDQVRLFRDGTRYALSQRWVDAYPMYEALMEASFLPATVMARIYAIAGSIRLFNVPPVQSSVNALIKRSYELAPEDPVVLCANADLKLSDRRFKEAEAFARRALSVDYELAHAHCLLGDSALTQGDIDRAEEHYQEAMQVRPGDMLPYQRLIDLAGDAVSERELDGVPDMVERGVAAEPLAEALLSAAAGNAFNRRGIKDRARYWFDRAIRADGEYLNGHVYKAYLQMDLGDQEGARSTFECVNGLAPSAHQGYLGLAMLAEEDGDAALAERWCRVGAEKSAHWSGRFLAKAASLVWRQGRRAEAKIEMIDAITAYSADPFVLDTVERIADELGRDDLPEARQFYAEILRAAGNRYEGRYHRKLGDLYTGEDDLPRALSAYRAATDVEPYAAENYTSVARTLRRLQAWPEARDLPKSAPPVVQEDMSFLVEMSLLRNAEANQLYSAQRYQDAIPLYEEAITYAPTDNVLLSNLSSAWEQATDWPDRLERLDRALEAIQRAAELAPEDAETARKADRLLRLRTNVANYGRTAELWPIVTPIALEVAADLIPYVEGENGQLAAEFGRHVTDMRDAVYRRFGVRVPGIRVRGNETDMPKGSYLIMIEEVPIVMGTISADTRFAAESPDTLRAAGIDPTPATNPETGEAAGFVSEAQWSLAEDSGIACWEFIEYPVRHLRAVIEDHLKSLLGHQEVQNLLDSSRDSDAVVAIRQRDELLSPLTAVLRALVDEYVPIAAFDALCARFLDLEAAGKPLSEIVEALRIIPEVITTLPGNTRDVRLLDTDERFESLLVDALHVDGDRPVLAMLPEDCQQALTAVRNEVSGQGKYALVLRDHRVRPLARKLFEIEFPRLAILAERELDAGWRSRVHSRVELEAASQ